MHFFIVFWIFATFQVLPKSVDVKEVKLKLDCKNPPHCSNSVIKFLKGGKPLIPSIKLDLVNSTKPRFRGKSSCQVMFTTLKPFKPRLMVTLQNCSGRIKGFIMSGKKNYHLKPGTKPNMVKMIEIKPSNQSFKGDIRRFDKKLIKSSRERRRKSMKLRPRTASSDPYEIEILALVDKKATAGVIEDRASEQEFNKNIRTIFIESDAKYKPTGFRLTLKKVVYLDWNHTLTKGLMNESYNEWYEKIENEDRTGGWFIEYPDWPTYDMIVMFTNREPNDTETFGISSLNTICSDLALSLVQLHSADPGNILTHEIAHVLNAMHDDGIETTCKDRKSYMYPEYFAIQWDTAIWSKCSMKVFKEIQKDESKSFCLHIKMK